MNNSTTVSVIIPIYNAEEFIVQSINKLMRQTLENIEIICVDDGSTDHSLQILKLYESDKFKVISQENSGAGIARNTGIKKAQGEYLAFMDIDDSYVSDDSLECLYKAAKDNEADVCSGNLLLVKPNGEHSKCEDYFEQEGWIDYLDYQMRFYHQRYLFKREFLEENQLCYPYYRRYQDPPFLCRALFLAKKIYVIPKDVYYYYNTFSLNKVSYQRVCDALDGVLDIMHFSKENRLSVLHNYAVVDSNMFAKYAYYHCIFGEKEIIAQKIEQIQKAIDVSLLPGFISLESKEYLEIENAEQYMDDLCDKAKNASKVILYGAGVFSQKLSGYFEKNNVDIFGVAISGVPEASAKERNITAYLDYADEALIIVATKESFQEEISKTLEAYNFKNVHLLNTRILDYVTRIEGQGYVGR